MKSIRAFIAIEIAAGIRRDLAELQEELAGYAPGRAVRWVKPGNIHLTLKFLGDTEPEAIDRISSRLVETAASFEPFGLRLGKLGCFPNPRRPRVIWVSVEGEAENKDDEPLMRLQQLLEQGLVDLGVPAEKRRFHPHLTLGRVKDSRAVIEARLPWRSQRATGQQQVGEICLIQSELRPAGAVYTVLKRARLTGKPAGDS